MLLWKWNMLVNVTETMMKDVFKIHQDIIVGVLKEDQNLTKTIV